MEEITKRLALFIIPKQAFSKWALLYNEKAQQEVNNRLNEKHVYLIQDIYDDNLSNSIKDRSLETFLEETEFSLLKGHTDLKWIRPIVLFHITVYFVL